jgi:hypothetical protein
MNADETEVFEFLKQYPRLFVSAVEVSKKIGHRRRFLQDRNWARPILRRMELDGILESNPSGEYRLKEFTEGTAHFLAALERPGIELGETTIISIHDLNDQVDSVQKTDAAPA